MRKNISVYEIEEKKSKSGKTFWIAKTSDGNMSVWDKTIAENLKGELGKICDVEVEVSGEYKNIKELLGAYGTAEPPRTENKDKLKSMFISYAKDMYVEELKIYIPFCETKEDVKKVIDEQRQKFFKTITGLYEAYKQL